MPKYLDGPMTYSSPVIYSRNLIPQWLLIRGTIATLFGMTIVKIAITKSGIKSSIKTALNWLLILVLLLILPYPNLLTQLFLMMRFMSCGRIGVHILLQTFSLRSLIITE